MYLAAQTANNVGTIWVGFWAGAIGASNTMVLGGFISIAATAFIGVLRRPIRDFRSDDLTISPRFFMSKWKRQRHFVPARMTPDH